MPPRHLRKGRDLPPIATGSPLSREKLPAPLVYYPGQNGAFFAFAAERDEPPALCTCAKEAVQHLFRLSPEPLRLPPLDYTLFPEAIARTLVGAADPIGSLRFRPGLCHRCNDVAPALRYCHEAAGQKFVQTWGWYINLTCLRLGIHPTSHRYLPDLCPPRFHDLLHRIQAVQEELRQFRAGLAALMNAPRREIPRSEQSHWPNVTKAELAPLESIEQQLNQPKYELWRAMQNLLRAEFGVKAVGDHWQSETALYDLICHLFPEDEILRHHRPDWMEGLELDLYLPARKLAIEYQGQQHFKPIDAWGGTPALQELQARDARKAALCQELGLRLITIEYTEPLTEAHIKSRLAL